ncbi:MAG: hypothetical protein V3V02_05370 [Rhizobiaceae bacterium]
MSDFSKDDIRAAVAAGLLNERQAAGLLTLSQERLGMRDGMVSDDEPFEFFKGFSEIFITVGLWLLFSGILAFGSVIGGALAVAIIGLILTWVFALYYTKKRRMSLPSISLAAGFGLFLGGAVLLLQGTNIETINVSIMAGVGMVGMLLYFRIFKLPFSMFVFGIFGLIMIYSMIMDPQAASLPLKERIFDLSRSSGLAYGSLIFGLLAFALGIYFDTKDPHRISRHSATGFWLHILAAPVIVNTMAMTLFNSGGASGYLMTALLLMFVTIVSLVIDRRSFLTAGIGYLGAIIAWAFNSDLGDGVSMVFTLLILGVFITMLGTWWTQIRAWLMRLLPDFPYKDRFPPYVS